jgi:glycosyltransferase involved in cell wall biosynthesis
MGETDSASMNIIAVIPALNEDRFIGSVVLKARQQVAHVIVIDDGSSDQTQLIAEQAGAIVAHHAQNQGKGTALNTGIALAREYNADIVVFLDADGQHDPRDIPLIVQPIIEGNADIVIGSRFLDRPNRAPLYRQAGQRAMTLITNTASGVQVTDSWSGFRAISRRAIDVLNFRERGWGIEPEFQFQAGQHNLVTVEVPIDVDYSEPAKRNPVMHGIRTLTGIARLFTRHRPVVMLATLGLGAAILGLAAGVWVVERYLELQELAAGVALIAIALIILGMLTLYTAIIIYMLQETLQNIAVSRSSVPHTPPNVPPR